MEHTQNTRRARVYVLFASTCKRGITSDQSQQRRGLGLKKMDKKQQIFGIVCHVCNVCPNFNVVPKFPNFDLKFRIFPTD